MSDFLTNLVMRSFAQTPSVQPMTLSTYAAPEPEPQIEPEHFIEPVRQTETVEKTNERELVIEKAPLAEAPPTQQESSELHHPKVTQQSVILEEPRAMSKPDQTIAPPAQPKHQSKPVVQRQKVEEPLIVEQVIENFVERPIVKTIERPTIRTIKPTTVRTIEQSTIETAETVETVGPPSVTSIERSIEQSSITIENTEHVTNSFTTLVPKVTPQSLPALNLKPRPITLPAEIPGEEQQQASTTSPENVVNVAIGRIEVRATPAPTPRREHQGPKVMTLDDYVQQRSRGAQ